MVMPVLGKKGKIKLKGYDSLTCTVLPGSLLFVQDVHFVQVVATVIELG